MQTTALPSSPVIPPELVLRQGPLGDAVSHRGEALGQTAWQEPEPEWGASRYFSTAIAAVGLPTKNHDKIAKWKGRCDWALHFSRGFLERKMPNFRIGRAHCI